MLLEETMNNDLNIKILESYVEIDKIHDEINNKMFEFITKANELVELSNDGYQIEKTLKLNKISLKDYVLTSECCISLKENNITGYSIDELRSYLSQYEKTFNVDCSKYFLSLSLYQLLEEIESLVDKKIDLEFEKINKLISNITDIKKLDSNSYEQAYFNMKRNLDNNFNDGRLNEKSYNICVQVLNDIFNFYISGYPTIPDEYLYHEDN